MSALAMLFLLLAGHALADYPLQGDFLAKAKNRAMPIPGVPFYQALGAHALIHAAFVFAAIAPVAILHCWLESRELSRSTVLLCAQVAGVCAWFEILAHALIDDAKCTGKIGFNTDQALHVACKVIWTLVALAVVA